MDLDGHGSVAVVEQGQGGGQATHEKVDAEAGACLPRSI
jgi:hypothetical protein